MDFEGVIVEESLDDASVLKRLKINKTEVEKVTKEFKTPWLKHWTLRYVTIPEKDANSIAEEIGRSISKVHSSSWFADIWNDAVLYVIFRGKVFRLDRTRKEQFEDAAKYALSVGIPRHQLGFMNKIKS